MAFHDKAIRLYSDALKSLITKDFPIDIVQEINNIPQRNVLENNFIEYKTKYTLKRRSFSESSISHRQGNSSGHCVNSPIIKIMEILHKDTSLDHRLQLRFQNLIKYFGCGRNN